MRPHPPLHCPLLSRIPHILGTLNFVGVSDIPLVGLNLLPRVQKMTQHFVEYFNISELTRWVWTLDPHQVTPQDTHAQLIAEGGFPSVLVGRECILRGSGGKNVNFSNGPNSTSECSKLLY